MITMYGIKNCDTIKKARNWLDNERVAYNFHDYKVAGVDKEKLEEWVMEHGWETITGNCDTLLYLGGNEQSTHEYISKLLGKETIDTRTHGQTKGRSGSYSTNMQITGRELLTPDEVRVLNNRNALLFVRGFPAIMDKKYDLESHPNNKKTKNGGYPPYIHKEDIFRGIPFAEAFDFANAEDYEYFEGDE